MKNHDKNNWNEKLPVLISVPHGGNEIPPELRSRVALTEREIFNDSDALTRQIYNFTNEMLVFIDTPIARACVDLNRSPNDRPPAYPDGVVKTETVDRCPVYQPGRFPDEALIHTLLNNYYFPYHYLLDSVQDNKQIIVALDCHSMLAESPPISAEPGKIRPLICLSNGGDKNGSSNKSGVKITCPPKLIKLLAKCFRKEFNNEDGDVKINDPFLGGYIINTHFKGTIPWIQVEINRKLYLSPPYFDADNLTVTSERIAELRNKILTVIRMFVKKI